MSRVDSFKVIVVEDEHRIRNNLIKKIPQAHSRFMVSGTASDGRRALELISESVPDLLITDIRMPVMDGLKLIEKLYFSNPSLPVIILSGYDDFNFAKKALHFGVKDYILKPVSLKDLSAVLGRLEIILDQKKNNLAADFAAYAEGQAAEEICIKAAEFLRLGYTRECRISDLAFSLNLSPVYLSRIFKKTTGKTPGSFLTELRINRAKELLSSESDLEIKEIAAILGFSDQGYFSRLFKKNTGMSPLDYRRRS